MALGIAGQSAAFTSKMGRAIVCVDSYQYVATAEALLDPELTPHFEMRKPGYPLFLAGVQFLTGQLGWTAVVANHLLLAMLPLAAYGFGVHLRSRGLGWVAAILLLARLQTAFPMRTADFGNWMMSEALFTFLLSFALLLFFVGLRRDRFVRWMVPAGILMGSAWLTRGTVTAVIPIAFLAIVWIHRSRRRRMLAMSVAFVLPIAAFVMFECSLNRIYGGQFRPSHGTGGSCMWAYRMQAFQGAAVPESDEVRFLLALLPE
ncbi:MAG: glycosyltransferase family 39 protein, partial [Planctomycetes bacterium]|nr:glycosyltransferase family 39 protein [Planctomycetota bacterium]